jgi:hypothetical protein
MCLKTPILLFPRKSTQWPESTLRFLCNLLPIIPMVFATLLTAQSTPQKALGIAWGVRGAWKAGEASVPIRTGNAVSPGSLLQPSSSAGDHSINILLPDGQQIFYQCFTSKDCAHGFRVPALFRPPEPFTAEMLGRIRAVLAQQQRQGAAMQASESHIARDEVVVVPGPGNRIEVGGLATALSNGEYSGDLRTFDARYPEQSGIPLQKAGRTIALIAPGPGLFVLTIVDSMKRPRIEFMIAVVSSAQGGRITEEFNKAHELLTQWREEFFGWPMHDFQRAYLQSLMLDIRPNTGGEREMASTDPPPVSVTAEPIFSPRPGVFAGDISVALECATPGAVIHYSIDNSQPLENSAVYRAPIVVKGVPLRVKAYAESQGKKDSPVVTGVFLVKH